MSVGGTQTAIVSLGMSCQSARQIRASIEVLNAALGEDLEPERHFFDGLISPINGLARLFEDGFPIFERSQIAPGPGHPTWQPYGIRFLHHFREEGGEADIDRHFQTDLARFTHLRNKFVRLGERKRIVFVISNSQNNLAQVAADTEMESITFDPQELRGLQHAVDRYLERSCEYLIVSHPNRHGGSTIPELKVLEADDSDWTGDKTQWRALFQEYLSRSSVIPFAV